MAIDRNARANLKRKFMRREMSGEEYYRRFMMLKFFREEPEIARIFGLFIAGCSIAAFWVGGAWLGGATLIGTIAVLVIAHRGTARVWGPEMERMRELPLPDKFKAVAEFQNDIMSPMAAVGLAPDWEERDPEREYLKGQIYEKMHGEK